MANWFMLKSGTDKTETLINLDLVPQALQSPDGSVTIYVRADLIITINGNAAGKVWDLIKLATVKNMPAVNI